VNSFPSLKNKISDRFHIFFEKFRTKILFQDQDIYKVSLSKLLKVLRIVLKFSCSGIIDDHSLNTFEQRFGLNHISDSIHIKTRRTSIRKSNDKSKKTKKVFNLGDEDGK
jgi:hypothetical protein